MYYVYDKESQDLLGEFANKKEVKQFLRAEHVDASKVFIKTGAVFGVNASVPDEPVRKVVEEAPERFEEFFDLKD